MGLEPETSGQELQPMTDSCRSTREDCEVRQISSGAFTRHSTSQWIYLLWHFTEKRGSNNNITTSWKIQCKCGLVMLWEGLSPSWWFPALHFLWMLGHLPGWVIKSLSKLIIFALFLLTEEANCAPTVIISFIASAQGWRTVTGETNRPQEEGAILLKPSYPIQTPGPEMGEL